MVTFPLLGKMGRLGNQLFQIAATISHAAKLGANFGFPRWPYAARFPLKDCFFDSLPGNPQYCEKDYNYYPIPESCLALEGRFQSPKYFIEHVVRELLTPIGLTQDKMLSGTASVHVRRGDYVKMADHFYNLPISYYKRAADLLRSRGAKRFLVFSDDPDWCKANICPVIDADIASKASDIDHLIQIALCEHHIIANSSFSWWGAWLGVNPHKTVVAPNRWFGPLRRRDTKDQLPADWIKIDADPDLRPICPTKPLKLFTFFTPSHEEMYKNYFLPSAAEFDTLAIVDQRSGSGDIRTPEARGFVRWRAKKMLEIIKANMGDVIIFSDVDIVFHKPVSERILSFIQDQELVAAPDRSTICAGFFAVRCNERIVNMFTKVVSIVDSITSSIADQVAINKLRDMVKWKLLPNSEFWNLGAYGGWDGTAQYFTRKGEAGIKIPKEIRFFHANFSLGVENKEWLLARVRVLLSSTPEDERYLHA
jgi:hypothetical protein